MTTSQRKYPQPSRQSSWKYEVPRLADRMLAREHLASRIERLLGQHRPSGDVLLVSAPAGYGKSTLLAQWASMSSVPVVWYHIDEQDRDPVTLISGIVCALRSSVDHPDWEIERVIHHMHAGAFSPAELKSAAARLAMDVQHAVREPLALVLTNVSELNQDRQALTVLDTLLNRPKDHLRLVLESREAPRLRFSTLLTQRRLDGIGIDDLKLRDDEFELLLEMVEADLDDATHSRLSMLADGWITGILLATGALLPLALSNGSADALDHDAIFDYLASEVIDALPTDLRAFAARAAILRYMTVPLCERVLGIEGAREYLARLEKHTGFVSRVGIRPREPVYRFQPLLRQALLADLHNSTDEQQLRDLRLRAAAVLEESGDLDEAVMHYVDAGAFDDAVALIERHEGAMLRAGRGMTLTRWLDQLPSSVRSQHPALCILQAELYRQMGHLPQALEAAETACAVLSPIACGQPQLAARALAARGTIKYVRGEYEAARDDCQQALAIVPNTEYEVQVQARFTLASCLTLLSEPEPVERILADAERYCLEQNDLWMLARLSYFRSKLQLARGAYQDALDLARVALRYAEEAGDEIGAIGSRINIGACRSNLGQMTAARADFIAAEEQSQSIGYLAGRIYALANIGDLEALSGHLREAAGAFEQTLALMGEGGEDAHLHVCALAGLAQALAGQGRALEALEQLSVYLSGNRMDELGADASLILFAAGLAHYYAGTFSEAEDYLRQARDSARQHSMLATEVSACLTLGAVAAATGDDAAAREHLEQALSLTQREVSLTTTLMAQARMLSDLWPHVERSAHPAARPLQQKLAAWRYEHIGASRVAPSASDGGQDPVASMPVRVYALGDARVLLGSERVIKWVRPRARELLFFMLNADKPLLRESILDALWPDKDPEAADEDFRKARFQLKQIFHRPVIEQYDGRWRLALDCWLDTREFDRAVDEGQQFLREGHLAAAATAFRRALSYWDGPYLDDVFSDWTREPRDRLGERHVDCLERLADLELRLGNYSVAARMYYQVLDIEAYRESAHRGLMTYYAVRGNLNQAIQQFKICEATLSGMNMPLEKRTIDLCKSILARMDASGRAFATALP